LVNQIVVRGSTILSDAEIAEIIQPHTGRELALAEVQAIADQITQRYLNGGYITTRAVMIEPPNADDSSFTEVTDRDRPPAVDANGTVYIQVVEGSLGNIIIEGTRRLSENYLRSRIALGAGTPLNTARLEDQLRLLRINPRLKSLEASLRASDQPGKTDLIVRITEAAPLTGVIGVDNYSPPSVGSERGTGFVLHRNVTGIGDEAFLSYSHTFTNGADVLDLGYRIPLNPMDGTLQLRFAPNWNKVTQDEFEELGIRGRRQLYELSYRQPVVRSPREELALSAALTYETGQTFVFDDIGTPFGIGPEADGTTRTTVLRLGSSYIRRDPVGAWVFQSQVNLGLDLFDATQNSGDDPDGQFVSWQGSAQRVQRLSETHLLIAQADFQLALDPLLPSQQFVIGGGQSLRGFRQNVRSGDNGFRFSLEDRITLQLDAEGAPILQLAPFVDAGMVWNHADNPNPLPDQRFLVGAGLGLLWQPFPQFDVRLDYAIPLVDLDDRGSNVQDDGFYFSVNYRF
jgi:hemolysin activation/secretion protein